MNQAHLVEVSVKDFKGIGERTVEFYHPITYIYGFNGSGKTTLFTAFLWLVANKDADGKDNPNVRPILADDAVVPTVEVVLETDHQVRFLKYQKLRRTGERIALTNFYEVNSVPVTESEFQKKLSETIGIDSKLILPLCHPDIFMSDTSKKGRDIIRKTIFSLCGEIKDIDCAIKAQEFYPEMEELISLLKFYTKDEIVATQMATKRKVAEAYGKKGEIIDAKIAGALASKVVLDVARLQAEEAEIRKQIAILKESAPVVNEERNRLMAKADELRKRLLERGRELERELRNRSNALVREMRTLMTDLGSLDSRESEITRHCNSIRDEIKAQMEALETARRVYDALADTEYNGSDICPTCGQRLPNEQIDALVEAWETKKAKNLLEVEMKGTKAKEMMLSLEESLQKAIAALSEIQTEAKEKRSLLDANRKEQDNLPSYVDYEDDEEYRNIEQEIRDTDAAVSAIALPRTKERDAEVASLEGRLAEITRLLGQAEANKRVDALVARLNEDKVNYAQKLAYADKILHLVEVLERQKNDICEMEVNKHFRLVNWVLFRTLKNGSYEPACIPTVDGKELGSSMNTALEMQAKIDIVRTLQEHYGVRLPVWVDNAEHMDSGSMSEVARWGMDLIFLKVSDENFAVHRT